MRKRGFSVPEMATLLVVCLLSLASAWMLERGMDQRALLEMPENDPQERFGGNDWVVWEDGPDGPKVLQVHPLIKALPDVYEGYLREGDVLRQLDFQDIYRAEVAEEIARLTPPGTMMLYQVERPGASGFGRTWTDVYVENGFHPYFSFVQSRPLWALFPWLVFTGAFLSLISLLIIFPMIRPVWREQWPMFLVIVVSFLVFSAMLLRHVNLLVRTEYQQVDFERIFFLGMAFLLPFFGLVSFFTRLSASLRWLILFPVTALAWSVYRFADALFLRPFAVYGQFAEDFVLQLFLLLVGGVLMLSVLTFWKGRSRLDKAFHLLSLLFVLPLWALYAQATFATIPWVTTTEFTDFLVFGSILIPLINAAASQLKFGRVSVVLTGALQYVVLFALAILIYFFLHQALFYFGVQFKYQAYLELSLLLLSVFVLRALFKIYEPRLRHYFVLAQQNRRDEIDGFVARIPQMTSSRQLLDEVVEAMRAYFAPGLVALRIKGEPFVGDDVVVPEGISEQVYQILHRTGGYWARSRQAAVENLPDELEDALVASEFGLAYPVRVSEQMHGMLWMGRKRRGVYNLDDLEVIGRIVRQMELTLGVLHLLEREKTLVQKNLEANLTALRSQINPHFLFNTLNTISALVHDAPDDAEEAVEKLAYIFRYTLKHSDRTFVTLKEEMSLVRTYLEIEKIRFGDRLQLHYDVDPGLHEVELPAFVMQTIVENCIKHGVGKIMGQGHVSIRALREEAGMRVEITDNGPGIDHAKITTSTGLNNIMTRLEKIYEVENLLYFENTGDGTRVTIKIPIPE